MLRHKLAKECKETFFFVFTQAQFESSCPKASADYDQFTGSKNGLQISPSSLKTLGKWMHRAGGHVHHSN